ncbi:TonB-dependent receptor [Ancylomarina sp. 16SWW S1-10-2]|uniref:SusC/RagA family TonB-linked outer membrane protein n=1 Tax=Ancylomarina sp. 16SWW S1-10-2 TaxID=2499681 RepID=UPI001E548371|nr:TonB-dependent receptor [Ancylomarina sp. 16SWW S1-10-2]
MSAFTIFSFLLSAMQVMAVNSNSLNADLSTNLADDEIENISDATVQKDVTGTITDGSGLSVPGVSVFIKGTTNGTITDFDGLFTISGVSEGDIIVVSFIGMKTQEIVFANQTSLNVVLEENTIGLNEVVAIGYTTRKKGEVTGSISTIKAEELSKTSNKDLAKSLAGKVTGLIVSDRGGYPGDNDMTLLIRGKSTLGNNSPLILIDGVTASTFSNLAPQDIESLNVLKDGAAAIYGARAANGVILITTKRGKAGKAKINLSSSINFSSFSASPDLMSSEQYAIYNNEIAATAGTKLPYSQEEIAKYAAGDDPNYPSTDWSDLTFADSAPETRTSLSISGGSDKVNYFVSGDYMDQKGMFESGDLKFKQYQVRSNIDMKLHETFTLGLDLSGQFGNRKEPGVGSSYIYKSIYNNEPTEVGVYSNGLPGWGGENGANPYVMSSSESGFVKQLDNDLRGKISYDWKLDKLTPGLRIKGFAGYRKQSNDIKTWYTPWSVYQAQEGSDEYTETAGFTQDGNDRILTESFWKYDELMLNSTIHYKKTFGEDHNISAFAGYEYFSSQQRSFSAQKKGFPSDDHAELFAGSDEGMQSTGTSYEWGRVNYFGSFSYDYQKKYFVDFTIRRDGSSNFGDKKFGTFPGVAVSWAIDKESFMDDISWLNSLRVRSSWAQMGNDRITGFQYLTKYEYGGTGWARPNSYIFGTSGTQYNSYNSSNVPNPDITWEKADMKNIGLSFSLFDYKLSGDVNYFYQKREDILVTRSASIPDVAGLTLPQENLGKVDNFGWEFELNWKDKIGEVDYNFGFNFTQAKNEIVYMDEAADVTDYMKQEGHSMDSYVVYKTAGIFRDQAQVDATAVKKANSVAGDPIYLDTNGDGKISSGDRVRTYDSNVPEIQYGVHGGVSYKNFDASFLFQGQAKAKMLVFFDQHGAKPDYVFNDRWTTENSNSKYPRAFAQDDANCGNQSGDAANFEGADFWLKDASFLRLKEVQLGYTFPKDKIKFGTLKVFARGFNLVTMFSDVYDLGLDPEASGYNNFRSSTYPSLKSYTFGFNLSF